MMRVLRVISSMKPETGGPCQGIRNSIPTLEKLGVHNEVLCFDGPDEEFLSHDNFPIHTLGPSKGPYSYSAKLPGWLRENLHRFDSVIIHGLWQHHSYGTYRAYRQYCKTSDHRLKLFVMPHGMLDPYFQRAKSRRLKAIRNYFFWKLLEHRVVEAADGLFFTCEQELLLAREPFSPYQPKSEINVGYGIVHPPALEKQHQEAFYARCPAVAGKSFFLFLSRIHPKKGVDLLIRAYTRLTEVNKNVPHLVIAGPGLETPFGEFLQKGSQNSKIHFPGMLKGAEKWGAFYSCDAFVLPSHQENFGIAVVEALACHKPVLISDQVNIFREIRSMGGGLVAADSEEGVYTLLHKWMDVSSAQKKRMEQKAYEAFQTYYSIEQAAQGIFRALGRASEKKAPTKILRHGIISHNI